MKKIRIRILMTAFALGAILWGCDSLIYDDLADCPQGVYVKFYTQTPCATEPAFIGDISSLVVFAFDEEGKLAATVTQENVQLTKDFEILVPVSDGNYSFIAWTNVNNNFTRRMYTSGVTTKKDVMLDIKSQNSIAARLAQTEHIWQGESPVVFLPDPEEYGSLYKHTAINLRELTNRVKIIVEFDQATMKNYELDKLNVSVSSANGTLNIDGTMPLNNSVLKYAAPIPVYTENSGTWDFNMLDLETGYKNNLKIIYNGNDKEEMVFDGDLLAMILLRAVDGGINLNCENDFTIKVVIKDYCAECWTHFACSIYVNDWLVHTYASEF